MNLITLDKISKSYSEKVLLDNVTLNINEGDKIGLIGLNGAGKSTLLKIVAGRDEFFSGDVTKSKDLRIEYLSQNTEYLSNLMQNKSFQSEYAQIRYFAAILKNSLSDFKYEKKEKMNKEVEIDMPLCNFKRKLTKKTLAEYEQEVGEEV